MRQCQKCGGNVPDRARHCNACGEPEERPLPHTSRRFAPLETTERLPRYAMAHARDGRTNGTMVAFDGGEWLKRRDVLMALCFAQFDASGENDAAKCLAELEAQEMENDIIRCLCGEAAQCTGDVDSDEARELTVRLNQAWRGEDPVGAAPVPRQEAS